MFKVACSLVLNKWLSVFCCLTSISVILKLAEYTYRYVV